MQILIQGLSGLAIVSDEPPPDFVPSPQIEQNAWQKFSGRDKSSSDPLFFDRKPPGGSKAFTIRQNLQLDITFSSFKIILLVSPHLRENSPFKV
jgi:hypothetical protein